VGSKTQFILFAFIIFNFSVLNFNAKIKQEAAFALDLC